MAKTLPKCLDSIKPYADRIVVVEGRFGKHWRTGPQFSTPHSVDDTVQIARNYGCEIILAHDLPQHLQRDLYLVGEEGDVYFVIDADQVLEGEFDKNEVLNSDVNVWGVWNHDHGGKPELWLWIRRHVGAHPRHNVGQLLIDGYGRLMDGTYPKYRLVEKFWLHHLREEEIK